MTVFVDCGLDRPTCKTYLSLYLTQQTRLDGKSPVSGIEIFMFLDEIDATFSYDFRACIYNALKQRPEWIAALDAIDELIEDVEPIVEPIVEPVTEPIVDPVTEPIVEPVTEPVTEPIPDLSPVANEVIINTSINTEAVVAVSASDPSNLPLTFNIVSAPTNGILTIDNGMFTYVPNQDYSGNDSATYEADNGTLKSIVANINIVVGI
jgi:hypothetical protein